MVGDRLDNDIAPARAHGWQTWQMPVSTRQDPSGGWEALQKQLFPG